MASLSQCLNSPEAQLWSSNFPAPPMEETFNGFSEHLHQLPSAYPNPSPGHSRSGMPWSKRMLPPFTWLPPCSERMLEKEITPQASQTFLKLFSPPEGSLPTHIDTAEILQSPVPHHFPYKVFAVPPQQMFSHLLVTSLKSCTPLLGIPLLCASLRVLISLGRAYAPFKTIDFHLDLPWHNTECSRCSVNTCWMKELMEFQILSWCNYRPVHSKSQAVKAHGKPRWGSLGPQANPAISGFWDLGHVLSFLSLKCACGVSA